MLAIDGLGIGGAEMVVRDLARSIDRRAFDVCVCCTKGLGPTGRELASEGIDAFVLPGQDKGRVDYTTGLKFRAAVKERNIEVVHTHATPALFDAGVCRLTLPRVRVVHTFHFGNYPYASWRHHIMEGLFSRTVDQLVAVGFEQRRRLQTTYRLPLSRIGVVWNGVTVATPVSGRGLREQIGTGNRMLVGTIAKLIEQKGLDDFLQVARLCKDRGHHMQFVIVGDGPLRPALEQRRRELDLEDTVVMPGWIPNAAAQALPAFDVFLQTSRWEAMSIAILEAMASALPITATRVGDNAHVLEDDVSGILVNSGDVHSMADALGRLRDRDLGRRLGEAAAARFGQKFTLDLMIRSYENIYRGLVGENAEADKGESERPPQ